MAAGRPRRMTREAVAHAVRLRKDGLSCPQIAGKLGVSARSVERCLAGVPPGVRVPPPDRPANRIREAWWPGVSRLVSMVGVCFGWSPGRVGGFLAAAKRFLWEGTPDGYLEAVAGSPRLVAAWARHLFRGIGLPLRGVSAGVPVRVLFGGEAEKPLSGYESTLRQGRRMIAAINMEDPPVEEVVCVLRLWEFGVGPPPASAKPAALLASPGGTPDRGGKEWRP